MYLAAMGAVLQCAVIARPTILHGMSMRSAGHEPWDIGIHILGEIMFTWHVLFSFMLIVGQLLVCHPPTW